MPNSPNAQSKVALVTGASRGIGAVTAVKLASFGADVVVNYRSKGARAYEVVAAIRRLGRNAMAIQADLTEASGIEQMMKRIAEAFGRLDILVLNASGGLENGKPKDYAMTLNRDAQLHTARAAAKLMHAGGRIVFVTSHWAHFYGDQPAIPGYEVVAKSKYAGETVLRGCIPEFSRAGVSLIVVSGDVIEGTITPRLLERRSPGLIAQRRSDAGSLPSVDEFAEAIGDAAVRQDLPSGHTIYVGPTQQ